MAYSLKPDVRCQPTVQLNTHLMHETCHVLLMSTIQAQTRRHSQPAVLEMLLKFQDQTPAAR